MSGKSASHENPDGIRRTVNGKTLAPRSKRKNERVVISAQRAFFENGKWIRREVNIETFVSKVFI